MEAFKFLENELSRRTSLWVVFVEFSNSKQQKSTSKEHLQVWRRSSAKGNAKHRFSDINRPTPVVREMSMPGNWMQRVATDARRGGKFKSSQEFWVIRRGQIGGRWRSSRCESDQTLRENIMTFKVRRKNKACVEITFYQRGSIALFAFLLNFVAREESTINK